MVKVTKKITKKLPAVEAIEEVSEAPAGAVKKEAAEPLEDKTAIKVKKCPFCHGAITPTYTDIATIKRFLSDRAKIVSRLRTGVCSKHQRILSKQIKYARHLALLPFTPKI